MCVVVLQDEGKNLLMLDFFYKKIGLTVIVGDYLNSLKKHWTSLSDPFDL